MTDYHTRFSCELDGGTEENAATLAKLYKFFRLQCIDEDKDIGFALSLESGKPSIVWIHDIDGEGDTNNVIQFVALCGQTLGLKGRWGFQWARTADRIEVDAFGGGAHIIDLSTGETYGYVDTAATLYETLQPKSGALS